MERLVDLHTHSTASDGSMTPRELVRHAKENGLSALALTDHDTVEGIEAALDEGAKTGLEVVAGIEISVEFRPEMHILGYFFGDSYKNAVEIVDSLVESRNERNPKIIKKLNEIGFDITMDEVEKEALGNIVARPHMAKVLMKKGYVKSTSEAFDKYLGFGKPAYFPKNKLTPEEGIKVILNAGGIPVLAHPIFLDLGWRQLDELLARLVSCGLKGIEAYYVENKGDDTGNLLRLAIKHNILATGGSDFHGSFKPDIEIGRGHGGLKVPYELLEKMKNELA
jgi:predicted metal-dependent phosphoesterase TrpH